MYRLDPANLGAGRMVRCAACRNEWYQGAPVDGVVPEPLDAPPVVETIAATEAPQPVSQPDWMIDDEPKDDLTFRPTTKGQFFLEDDMRVEPEAVAAPPLPASKTPGVPAEAILHRPMGMGAAAFGVFTYIFLFCLTFSGLLLYRGHIVPRLPATLSLYNMIGTHIDAPGQGLSFSAMSAENRIDKDAHSLAVSVKLSNISDHEAPYPAFRVAVKGNDGKVLQSWDFAPDKKTIAPGSTVPVALSFRDPPEQGKTAELTVTAD